MRLIAFRFFPNTSTDPVFEDPGGSVASVAHAATGKFLVTLTDSYLELVGSSFQVHVTADDTDLYAQGGDEAVNAAGGGTVEVNLKTGATNTNLAANANNFVTCMLMLRDSGATP
jgi:ferric-dicitrate binding protein FerR (iron transport regulator)